MNYDKIIGELTRERDAYKMEYDIANRSRDTLTKERDRAVADLKKHRKHKCDCCAVKQSMIMFSLFGKSCFKCKRKKNDNWRWRGLDE